MADVVKDIADLVVELRADMTQEEFAELVGISPSLVGHIEVGRRNLGYGSLEKMVANLGLDDVQRDQLRRARDAYVARKATPSPDADDISSLRGETEALRQAVRALLRLTDAPPDVVALLDASPADPASGSIEQSAT